MPAVAAPFSFKTPPKTLCRSLWGSCCSLGGSWCSPEQSVGTEPCVSWGSLHRTSPSHGCRVFPAMVVEQQQAAGKRLSLWLPVTPRAPSCTSLGRDLGNRRMIYFLITSSSALNVSKDKYDSSWHALKEQRGQIFATEPSSACVGSRSQGTSWTLLDLNWDCLRAALRQ